MQQNEQQDEFTGQGGSYLVGTDGKRTRVEEPTAGATRSRHPDAQPKAPAIDLAHILAGTAAEVIAALPTLDAAQLAELAALEATGKNRVTVMDAIASNQAK